MFKVIQVLSIALFFVACGSRLSISTPGNNQAGAGGAPLTPSAPVVIDKAAVLATYPTVMFNVPTNIEYSSINNSLYILDIGRDDITQFNLGTSQLSVLSGVGIGTGADWQNIDSFSINQAEDSILVYDNSASQLATVDISTGNRTFQGAATGVEDLVMNSNGTSAFVFYQGGLGHIDDVVIASGAQTVIADDTSAPLLGWDTTGLAIDSTESFAYAIDETSGVVRVNLADGSETQLCAAACGATMSAPKGIDINSTDSFAYAVDSSQRSVVRIDLSDGTRTVVSRDGTVGTGVGFSSPQDIKLNSANTHAFVIDRGNSSIFEVDLSTGNRAVLTSSSRGSGGAISGVSNVVVNNNRDTAYTTHTQGAVAYITKVDLATGNRTTVGSYAGSNDFQDIVLNSTEDTAYLTDGFDKDVSKVDIATGTRTSILGGFNFPIGLTLGCDGDSLYVVDYDGASTTDALYKVKISDGTRTTISDNSGSFGTGVTLTRSTKLAMSSDCSKAYVLDTTYDSVYEIDVATGNRSIITDKAGVGTGPLLALPQSIQLDAAESNLYVLDSTIDAIVKIEVATGNRTIHSDSTTGTGPSPNTPAGSFIDNVNGMIYYADSSWDAIFTANLDNGNRYLISK